MQINWAKASVTISSLLVISVSLAGCQRDSSTENPPGGVQTSPYVEPSAGDESPTGGGTSAGVGDPSNDLETAKKLLTNGLIVVQQAATENIRSFHAQSNCSQNLVIKSTMDKWVNSGRLSSDDPRLAEVNELMSQSNNESGCQ